jgi:hypothetical protein
MKKTAKKSARRAPAKRRSARARIDMRPEYDFTGAVRGKYAARFQAGTNLVLLDPDVAEAFQDSAAVNHALRALLELVPAPKAARRRRTA